MSFHALWSLLIKRIEDHRLRLAVSKLFNGLPPKQFDKTSIWGIKAAIRYDPCSSILKFPQLVNLSFTTASPNRAAVLKMRLHSTCIKGFKSCFW